VGEDSVQGEEVEKQEEPESEEEEELIDPFSDLDTPKGDLDKTYADLGIDGVSDKDSLLNYISQLEGEKNEQAQDFDNEEIAEYVGNIREIAKAGKDWKTYVNSVSEQKELDTQIGKAQDGLVNLKNYLESSDIKNKVNYLKFHYPNVLKLEGQELADALENLQDWDDARIIREANVAMRSTIASEEFQLESLRKKKEQADLKSQKAVEEARQYQEAFVEKSKAAIDAYEDPHSKTITTGVRKASREILKSEMKSYQLPSKLVEELFYTDGEFDHAKVTKLIGDAKYGSKKLDHLIKKNEIELFRQRKKPLTEPLQKGSAVIQSKKAKDSDDGDFDFGGYRGNIDN
jgi:hypothetical protein